MKVIGRALVAVAVVAGASSQVAAQSHPSEQATQSGIRDARDRLQRELWLRDRATRGVDRPSKQRHTQRQKQRATSLVEQD